MSSILVPLDGSPLAEESLPWAAMLARHSSRPVHLLGVYGYDEQLWEAAGIDPRNELAESRARLSEYLGRAAQGPRLQDLTVLVEARAGDVAAEIAAAAAERDADMIVITTHGAGGKDRGSVADKVVRTSEVPVLVVPPGCQVRPGLEGVVVALDGSRGAHAALAPARELAQLSGGTVRLLHVVDASIGWGANGGAPKGLAEALARAAERDMDAVATGEDRWDVRQGKVVDTILEFAHDNGCEVVVMATHGRSGRVRLDLGSVTDLVLRAADRPVLVVPAR